MEITTTSGTCGTTVGGARVAMPAAGLTSTPTSASPFMGSGRAWSGMRRTVEGRNVDVVGLYARHFDAQSIAKHDFPTRTGLSSCSPPV